MLERSSLVSIRDITKEDTNFILATWLRGLRYGNDWFQAIESSVYFTVYQKIIEVILADPLVTVKVACLAADPEVILGYSVYSGNRLDWLFVKKAWRGIGIARSLTPEGITVASHLTDVGRRILKNHEKVYFNPFSIT